MNPVSGPRWRDSARLLLAPAGMGLMAIWLALSVLGIAGVSVLGTCTEWTWPNRDVHTAIEMCCCLSGLAIVITLLGRFRESADGGTIFVAAALTAVAVLDAVHAWTPVGQSFVLLRGLGDLAAGALFVCVAIPRARAYAEGRWLLVPAVVVATAALAALTVASDNILPVMLVGNKFTNVALIINIFGAALLLASVPGLVAAYRRDRFLHFGVLACLAALIGVSAIVLRLSTFWNDEWWFSHLLRLGGYLLGMAYVVREFFSMLAPVNADELRGRRQLAVLLVLGTVMMVIGMTLYETVKTIISPRMTLWQSHVVTIVISSTMATVLAFLVLRKWQAMMSRLVSEAQGRQAEYQARAALSELLSLSLADLTLEEILPRFLDRLTAVKWLGVEPRGSIFLVEQDPETLMMKAQIGLGAPLLAICAKVPFGRCLCGRAASSGQTVFASHMDQRHDTRLPGAADHGHYCVPILAADKKVRGVINLYVSAGHQRSRVEDEFLVAAANVLAGILERKESERAVRESREFLDRIINSIRDPILVQDDQHRYLLVNEALCRLLHKSREELLGRTVRDGLPKAEADGIWERDEQVLKTGQDNIVEEGVTVLGVGTTLVTKKSLYVDPAGKRHLVAVLRDVTEIKQAQEDLRESEEKFRNVVNNIGIGISLLSPRMEVLTLNTQMSRWFPDVDPAARPLCHQVFNNPPREGVCSYCPTQLTLRDGQVHEAVTQTPAGRDIRNYRIISSPIKDASGQVVAAIEMVEDITDRKRLEDELRRSHDFLEQRVTERTADLTAAHQQLQVAQVELVQAEKMGMLGQLVAGVAHEINTPTGAILNVTADAGDHLRGLVESGSRVVMRPAAEVQWLVEVCYRLLARPQQQSEASTRTLRRQIEQDLRTQGLENGRRLAAVIAGCFGAAWRDEPRLLDYLQHEAGLVWLEHLLALKASTEITFASAQKIARIVRALRYYSHSGQDETLDINLNESLDNTLVILQNRLKNLAEVRTSLAADLPPVRCTSDVSQVWTNILNNACDAIEETQRPGLIEISSRADQGRAVVEIYNSGGPIPESILQKIYDPFFTTKPVGKGTGLGLGICTGILRNCGGTIAVRNERDGVTFAVTLPLGQSTVLQEASSSATPAELGEV